MEGISCPHCGSFNHSIADTRTRMGRIRRRRICEDCHRSFFTIESLEVQKIYVSSGNKTTSKRVPFDRKKLLSSILLATYDSSVSVNDINELLIERIELGNKRDYTTQELFELTANFLKERDYQSYVRYAVSKTHFIEDENNSHSLNKKNKTKEG